MRAVITRVNYASVEIDGKEYARIGKGFLVLLGVHEEDTEDDAAAVADRLTGMRIFEDDAGKMNISPGDAGAEFLIVSQFTLFADVRKRRPSFVHAAKPDLAIPLYEKVVELCREAGFSVQTGEFGAMMKVQSENDGPVTIVLDTRERS